MHIPTRPGRVFFSLRDSSRVLRVLLVAPLVVTILLVSACDDPPPPPEPTTNRATVRQLTRMIPPRVADRQGWAKNILDIMDELKIPATRENTCSIVAIVDQESNFSADPKVAGLGKTVSRELSGRLVEKFGPIMGQRFDAMLEQRPTPENSFAKRLEQVQTEQDLDKLYREMFNYFEDTYHLNVITGAASLIAGKSLSETFNPVSTLGSMQVHINYASEHARSLSNTTELRDELYTRDGGLYYGIHRLMKYDAAYDKPLYRFADYNSGVYSSRNAAFQQSIAKLTGETVALDGDLLAYNKKDNALEKTSQSEQLLYQVFQKAGVLLTPDQIRQDLLKEKSREFEQTETYSQIGRLFHAKFNRPAPYAIMPAVTISGPKLSRNYNTNWYATRVNGRFEQCQRQARRVGLR